MDGRDAFLTMAREKHYEFSSLRRCKYSTMSLLYELHTQGNDKFVYTCNTCNKSVETRYHCTQCDDFDLCNVCYSREGNYIYFFACLATVTLDTINIKQFFNYFVFSFT